MISAGYIFFLSLFLTTALVPLLVKVAPTIGLIDYPDSRKIHRHLIPRIGGIAIIVGMLVPTLLWIPLHEEILVYLLAIGLLAVFGVLDDRYDLDYRLKFLGQLGAALIVTLHGGVLIYHFPFIPVDPLPFWASLPLTLLVLMGVTNAINLSDGLDGLAGGTSLLAIGLFCLLAYQANDSMAMMLSLSIIGATIGFLRYNTYPARVFMGDCGSQFLGFSTGVLALKVTQLSNSALAPTLPLLVLGLPILDTLWVMLKRISERRSPFSPDRTHIHHRLLNLGFNQYEAVTLIYTVQIILVLVAYLHAYSSDLLILGLYGLFNLLVIAVLIFAQHHHYVHSRLSRHNTLLTRMIETAKQRRWLSDYPIRVITLLVLGMLLVGSLFVPKVDTEFGVLALILLLVLLPALLIRGIPSFALERLTLYSVVAWVTFMTEFSTEIMDSLRDFFHLLIGLLALFVAVWVRFAGSRFAFNPMDYLFVLVIILVPNIGDFKQSVLGVFAIELMILFYASEVLISGRERHWGSLRIGVIATLSVLVVRGLLV